MKNVKDSLNLPHEIEFTAVPLYGVTVDVKVVMGAENDLCVEIIPKNEDAARIRIVSSRMWFGLQAGHYLSVDLEEFEEQMGSKFIAGANIVKNIMAYGFEETAHVVGDKVIESQCVVPVAGNPIEFKRSTLVLPWTKRKARRQQYAYVPYAK